MLAWPKVLRRDFAALCFLGLVAVIFFWKAIFTSDYTILFGWDASVQWYAWYRFAADWVRKGVFPLWDPYVYGGHSFVGEAQAGLFYPFNLLQAFLIPADRSLAPSDIYWMATFHMFVAAASMYVFARVVGMVRGAALVAAIVFAFGGFVVHRLFGHLNIFYGVTWIPLLLALFHLSVRRRQPLLAVAAGLGLGMIALVGHLMPPVYSALIMGAYAVYLSFCAWRRHRGREQLAWAYPLLMLAVTGVLGLGVAAVQMLPSLEYEKLALRWTGTPAPALPGDERSPYWLAGGYFHFRPQQLVSLLIPAVYDPDETSVYLGILPLGLLVVGALGWRKNGSRFFVLLALAALAYSLGEQSIVHGLLWLSIPILDKARVAVRALFVVSFCVAVLAGLGVQAMLLPTKRVHLVVDALQRYAGWAIGIFAVGAVGLSVWGTHQLPPADLDPYYGALVQLTLAWGTIALWRRLRLAPNAWLTIVIVVLLFDLFSHGTTLFRLVRDFDRTTNWSPEIYYAENGALRFLRQQPGYFRVDVQGAALSPNFGDVWQVFTVSGFSNTMTKDYHGLRDRAWLPGSRFYDLLNIRYIVTTDTIKTLPLVYDGDVSAGDLKVYENLTALPRAWLVYRATVLPPGWATWSRIKEPGFDPSSEAIVATPVDLPGQGAGGSVVITEYTLHAIALAVDTPADALLVTSENYYPGWTVRVDGQQMEVVKVYGALRGVRVPAGRHDVIFTYEPRSVKVGAMIAAVTLLLAALLGLMYALRGMIGRRVTSS